MPQLERLTSVAEAVARPLVTLAEDHRPDPHEAPAKWLRARPIATRRILYEHRCTSD